MTDPSEPTADPLAAAVRSADPAAGDRKFRLFNCACVRRVFPLLRAEAFRAAVEVAERHADGLASDAELGSAVREVKRASGRRGDQEWAVYHAVRYKPGSPRAEAPTVAGHAAKVARAGVSRPDADQGLSPAWDGSGSGSITSWEWSSPDGRTVTGLFDPGDPLPVDLPPEAAAWIAATVREVQEAAEREEAERRRAVSAARAEADRAVTDAGSAYEAERAAQLRLLHDVLGPPDPPPFDAAWQTPDVAALADAIYAGRAFGRMPELADALATAGCREPVVLAHCRTAGEHARGCWVLDGLLGRA